MFHHAVVQLLFISNISRREINTEVSFITSRVKKPDEDNWGKLKRVLKYLKVTKYMKIILRVESLEVVRWWIYAS